MGRFRASFRASSINARIKRSGGRGSFSAVPPRHKVEVADRPTTMSTVASLASPSLRCVCRVGVGSNLSYSARPNSIRIFRLTILDDDRHRHRQPQYRTMAGHNKWSKIKRKKGANDVARSTAHGKIARAIQAASRKCGGDMSNLHLQSTPSPPPGPSSCPRTGSSSPSTRAPTRRSMPARSWSICATTGWSRRRRARWR